LSPSTAAQGEEKTHAPQTARRNSNRSRFRSRRTIRWSAASMDSRLFRRDLNIFADAADQTPRVFTPTRGFEENSGHSAIFPAHAIFDRGPHGWFVGIRSRDRFDRLGVVSFRRTRTFWPLCRKDRKSTSEPSSATPAASAWDQSPRAASPASIGLRKGRRKIASSHFVTSFR